MFKLLLFIVFARIKYLWTGFLSYVVINWYDDKLGMEKECFKVFNMFYPSPNILWDLLYICG